MGSGWFGRSRAADPAGPGVQAGARLVGHDQFALNLVERAVTAERVAAVIAAIAGDRIAVGPLFFGPGDAASATGVGAIGRVQVSRVPGRQINFEASIPGELSIELTVGRKVNRYHGSVDVPLRIGVQLAEPVLLLLEVTPVRPADVAVRLRTSGMAAFVLQTLGDADTEIAAQVALVVNQKVQSVESLCRIDVGTLLDRVWDEDLLARLAAPR